jgi:hypothetical protein
VLLPTRRREGAGAGATRLGGGSNRWRAYRRNERTSVCSTRAKNALPTVSSDTDSSRMLDGATPCASR